MKQLPRTGTFVVPYGHIMTMTGGIVKFPLEKEIQADIVKLLETVGAAVYKIGTTRKRGDHQGTMQTPGIPDLVAFVRIPAPSAGYSRVPYSVELWIEVKRPGVAMSDAQTEFCLNALTAGCAHVVGGVGEVLDWLVKRGVVK